MNSLLAHKAFLDWDAHLAGGLIGASIAAVIVVGILLSTRRPLAGSVLLVITALSLAVLTWQFDYIPPVLTLLIAPLGVVALWQRRPLR